MSKKLNEFLAQKVVKDWVKDNNEFIESFMEIVNACIMFEAKYGQRIFIDFKRNKQKKK